MWVFKIISLGLWLDSREPLTYVIFQHRKSRIMIQQPSFPYKVSLREGGPDRLAFCTFTSDRPGGDDGWGMAGASLVSVRHHRCLAKRGLAGRWSLGR